MKKRLLHSVSMLVFLICTAFTAWAGEVTLTILHTNDSHGAGAEVTKKAFSYAQIAALADSITPRPVLLDAGDIVEGSVFASETEGLLSINAMRLAGYDAVTLGNHEFNRFRKSTIERLTGAAGGSLKGNAVTIVNANVSGSSELDKLPAYTIIERDGVRIGVFGLTTTSTMGTANPAHNKGLTFEHGITVAKRTVAEMKALPANKRPHIIVALVHMGFEPGMTEPEYD